MPERRRLCPTRLAAGTVDSMLGKLRAIFNNMGRTHDSNPVAHPRVKEYLKFVRDEQAGAGVLPSQATPLFFEKFSKLVNYLRDQIRNSSKFSVTDKYILVRDTVFSCNRFLHWGSCSRFRLTAIGWGF